VWLENSLNFSSRKHTNLGEPTYLTETSLSPVLVKGVTKDMLMWDEETFGPSASIFVVENDSEAISIVNDSAYGLDAFIHTGDMRRAIDMANHLEVGRVRVNGPGHERKLFCPPLKPTY
jgi:acyl-CoA reductase-like NAD-dependent aldehyde dehydrogenase